MTQAPQLHAVCNHMFEPALYAIMYRVAKNCCFYKLSAIYDTQSVPNTKTVLFFIWTTTGVMNVACKYWFFSSPFSSAETGIN